MKRETTAAMKIAIQILLIIYAALVGMLGQYAAFDSADLGYPSFLVVLTSLSALSLSISILIIGLGWRPRILIHHWKFIFWFSLADLVIGLVMDGTIPTDFNARTDPTWIVIALFVVTLLGPAYVFSYLVAYHRRGN